ncbi:MAG: metallophosphoesterase [Myxococcota bacterium]
MTVRIAHATDIHWFVPPSWGDFAPRRVIGTLNLYARGRRHEFDDQVQDALVAHLRSLAPDLVLITGDLTAQALRSEFAKALKALSPLLDTVPTLILRGNHDAYTPGAERLRLFANTFGAWSGQADASGVVRVDVGDATVFGLDPNLPSLVTAVGQVPEAQLRSLEAQLADPALDGRSIVLGIHYPPVDRAGVPYDRQPHGLLNARALLGVLERAPHRPRLIACGHIHHGYKRDLVLSDGATISVVNCGTSGHSYQPDRGRAAAMALYTLDGTQLTCDRWVHDGARFVPEPGGAWASGR